MEVSYLQTKKQFISDQISRNILNKHQRPLRTFFSKTIHRRLTVVLKIRRTTLLDLLYFSDELKNH